MSRKIKLFFVLLFFFVTAIFAGAVFAQVDLGLNYGEDIGLPVPATTDLREMAVRILQYFLSFVGLVAVAVIIYGGFRWTTSGGDPEKIGRAKKTILNGAIGLIIVIAAFAIVQYIIGFGQGMLSGVCTDGETRSCGCASAGTQFCSGGSWSSCVNGNCSIGQSCCSWGCAPDCSTPPPFLITSYQPPHNSSDVIRNKVVRVNFSHAPDSSTVTDASFYLTKESGGQNPAGAACASGFDCQSDRCEAGQCVGDKVAYFARVVSGSQISFTAWNDCPAPYAAWKCFDRNAKYKIKAENSIRRAGDQAVLSCGTACESVFTTGVVIDTSRPFDLELIFNSGNLCVDTVNPLLGKAKDDTGIDQFVFRDSLVGQFAVESNPACSGAVPNIQCQASANWDTTAGYSLNTNYTLVLKAMDADNNDADLSRAVSLRPAHCCDGLKNGDETGVDCGGSCALCQGAACGSSQNDDCATSGTDCHANDNRCASYFCSCENLGGTCQTIGYSGGVDDCCSCQNAPIIDWLSPVGGFCREANGDPTNNYSASLAACQAINADYTFDNGTPNGAVGNFVTIHGRNFGATAGVVNFSDSSGQPTINALLANNPTTGNPDCGPAWSDQEIIVVVPPGAQSGPIRVTQNVTNYYADSPLFLVVNTIVRPGLCQVDPSQGVYNDSLTFKGIKLQNNLVFFGNQQSYLAALNSAFPANSSGSARVPSLRDGRTTVFTRNSAQVASNFLNFTKSPEANAGPAIISFSPGTGPSGQYVTISGRGFGQTKSASKVYFTTDLGSDGTEAVYKFPRVCADSVWQDKQIIVKAPSISDNDYYLKIILASGQTLDTSALTPSTFKLDSNLPLAPSLCLVRPDRGPHFAPVSLWGEYFGATPGKVRFYNNQDQSGASLSFWGNGTEAMRIDTTVPNEAITGPVQVINASNLAGNALNFTVGACTTNNDCGGSDICCPSETSFAGRCASSLDACYPVFKSAVFEWNFSTKKVPGLGEPCYEGALPATCDLNQSECRDPLVCSIADCRCGYPTDPTDSCQGRSLNANICATGYCPNSPGQCSPYTAARAVLTGADCVACESANGFIASSSADVCYQDNSRCWATTTDRFGREVEASCEQYAGSAVWVINTLSCPDGWNLIGAGRCKKDDLNGVDCNVCPSGTVCREMDGEAKYRECITAQERCPGLAKCNDSNNKCETIEQDKCECCCEIGQDARDCCLPLKCEGTCGVGHAGTVDYGHCTGCNIPGATTADKDAACNCFGHSGKYCDTEAADGQGVCRDCAELGNNAAECSGHAACCVDGDLTPPLCRGVGTGSFYPAGLINYCAASAALDRPEVHSTVPTDNTTDICRNPLIKAEFDQVMDLGSFTGNVLLVGDYGQNLCPANTQFLVQADTDQPDTKISAIRPINKLARLIQQALHWFSQSVSAWTAPASDKNYCAVSAKVSGLTLASASQTDPEGNKLVVSQMYLAPTQLLDADRLYYVIIKGDPDTTDKINIGVTNASSTKLSLVYSDHNDQKQFNGQDFKNSYIWSFTTGDKICLFDRATITPLSYLFNTVNNDISDDSDWFIAQEKDDGDKVFSARAWSRDGQEIVPAPGLYEWQWSWQIANTNVAEVHETLLVADNPNKAWIWAENINNGRTKLTATGKITRDDINLSSTLNQNRTATADIFVFVCENPWPQRPASGNWAPWQDSGALNNNMEFYYCRDKNEAGTHDDLPAILNSPPSTPSQTVLLCSSNQQLCPINAVVGTLCDNNQGKCRLDVLKELYFFRENLPAGANTLNAQNTGLGRQARTSWTAVSGVTHYKLYWWRASTTQKEYALVEDGINPKSNNSNAACVKDTNYFACTVSGLDNNLNYAFALATYNNTTGAESPLSNEVIVTIKDSTPPSAPNWQASDPLKEESEGTVRINWQKVAGAKGYYLYIGTATGNYGDKKDLDAVEPLEASKPDDLSILATGLNKDNIYYFALSAYDEYGNEGDKSGEKNITLTLPTP